MNKRNQGQKEPINPPEKWLASFASRYERGNGRQEAEQEKPENKDFHGKRPVKADVML